MREHRRVEPSSLADQADVALVVLAAGRGTRMRSAIPKQLHPIAGLPMLAHVLRAGTHGTAAAHTILVANTATADAAQRNGLASAYTTVIQEPARGTADAVRCALPKIGGAAWIVVLYADHPLLTAETVRRLLTGAQEARARVTVLTCLLEERGAYGRVARDAAGRVVQLVELAADEPGFRTGRAEINSGMMVLDAAWAREMLPDLPPNPASGEYYLTDLVALAADQGPAADGTWPVATVTAEPEVALGINDRRQLAVADAIARERIRQGHMAAGVTLIGPETIFIDDGVSIGQDTTLLPFTTLGVGTVIGERCTIGPHASISDSRLGNDVIVRASTVAQTVIGDGSDVGPYAHLRPGTDLGQRVHIGNFAELKNARVAADVRIGHVSYLGDATIGAETNIGAGVITANYDGVNKHQTEIGDRAFIGSDSMLIAPLRIGHGARTGAGAVVTRDVADGTTVVGVPARVVPSRTPPDLAGTEEGA